MQCCSWPLDNLDQLPKRCLSLSQPWGREVCRMGESTWIMDISRLSRRVDPTHSVKIVDEVDTFSTHLKVLSTWLMNDLV